MFTSHFCRKGSYCGELRAIKVALKYDNKCQMGSPVKQVCSKEEGSHTEGNSVGSECK